MPALMISFMTSYEGATDENTEATRAALSRSSTASYPEGRPGARRPPAAARETITIVSRALPAPSPKLVRSASAAPGAGVESDRARTAARPARPAVPSAVATDRIGMLRRVQEGR